MNSGLPEGVEYNPEAFITPPNCHTPWGRTIGHGILAEEDREKKIVMQERFYLVLTPNGPCQMEAGLVESMWN